LLFFRISVSRKLRYQYFGQIAQLQLFLMKLKEIIQSLEELAPPSYQEHYDNSGLIVGNREMEITSAIISLDATEAVVEEAISMGANLIISHHPIIFSGLKKLIGQNYVERTVIQAIKNNIAIYAIHTNLDSVANGVSAKMCEKLGLENCKILKPKSDDLLKLVFFVPTAHAEITRNAVFEAGAGHIGNYDACSFNLTGAGTFRAGNLANPYVGEIGKMHTEQEVRIETIFSKHLQSKVIRALISAHPYEEVAYDIYALANSNPQAGFGMIGFCKEEIDETFFLEKLKQIFELKVVKHSPLLNKKIKKIALCGGSGSFLLNNAISAGADIFISGDFTYHQFFDGDSKILIADIGHYESEQFTKNLIFDYLTKKFPTFAAQISKTNTNPINYI